LLAFLLECFQHKTRLSQQVQEGVYALADVPNGDAHSINRNHLGFLIDKDCWSLWPLSKRPQIYSRSRKESMPWPMSQMAMPTPSSLALSTRADTVAGVGKYTVWRSPFACREAEHTERQISDCFALLANEKAGAGRVYPVVLTVRIIMQYIDSKSAHNTSAAGTRASKE
jgi:hypothetical protein